MVFDISKVSGIPQYDKQVEKQRTLYYKDAKVFLVVNKNTLEIRCDSKLAALLKEKYESVMESRYFGRHGIEIVPSSQLTTAELEDLVRLSYNLTN